MFDDERPEDGPAAFNLNDGFPVNVDQPFFFLPSVNAVDAVKFKIINFPPTGIPQRSSVTPVELNSRVTPHGNPLSTSRIHPI